MKRWFVYFDPPSVRLTASQQFTKNPPNAHSNKSGIYITAKDELDAWIKATKWKEQEHAED